MNKVSISNWFCITIAFFSSKISSSNLITSTNEEFIRCNDIRIFQLNK